MQTLAKQVMEHAAGAPEGTPLVAKDLLHLGNHAAVDQVLSRLVQRSALLRAGRGIYVLPVESRFGTRAPSAVKMVEGLANQRGQTSVPHGAAAANALGLTTQVPMRAVYLTSGPSRRLKLGAQMVEFRHAPIWQLIFPGQAAGTGLARPAKSQRSDPEAARQTATVRTERSRVGTVTPANLDGSRNQRSVGSWLSSSSSPAAKSLEALDLAANASGLPAHPLEKKHLGSLVAAAPLCRPL